jgi:DNA-binding NarL/FixJ family response regulator
VLVADRDDIVCRALSRLLNNIQDIQVVATSSDVANIFVLVGRMQPDIVVIDAQGFHLDTPKWMELIRRTRLLVPSSRVVVLSIYASLRNDAFAAGACRFLLKDCTRNDLVAAIRLANQQKCQQK